MSKENWHRYVALVGLASVVVAIIVAPILVAAQDQWRDRQQHEQQAQTQYEEAGRRFALLGQDDKTVAIESREFAREARAKSELDAQWATATWSQYQFMAAALGVIFTGGALIFAHLAWKAAKAGVIVSREVGQSEVRCYVSVEDFRAPLNGPDCFNFAVWNTGITPARSMRWTFLLVKYYNAERTIASIARPTPKSTATAQIAGGAKDHRITILLDHANWVRGGLADIRGDHSAEFLIIVHFMDVFGRRFELRELVKFGNGRGTDPSLLRIMHVESSEREISEEEFRLGPDIPAIDGEEAT